MPVSMSVSSREATSALCQIPVFAGNVDSHCLSAGPDGYFVGHETSVWGSTDGGKWTVIVDVLPEITCLA
jgi:hypothetical protein